MVAALPYAWASRARACRCRERLRPRVLRPTAPRLSLWQESLTGNSKTAMLVTVAPTQSSAAAAGAALEFGVKARAVSLGPASKNKESMQTAMNKVNTTMSALAEHAGGSTQRRGPSAKNR